MQARLNNMWGKLSTAAVLRTATFHLAIENQQHMLLTKPQHSPSVHQRVVLPGN